MLIYSNLNIDAIDVAIRKSIIRDRGLVYNATIEVLRTIILPLVSRGKFEFNLTRAEIVNHDIPQRTAANVISLLLNSGVMIDTGETVKVGNYRPMKLYVLSQEFFIKKTPTNYDELEVAVVQAGFPSSSISLVRSQLEKEFHKNGSKTKITTPMLIERFEELTNRTQLRKAMNYHWSKKVGI